jgi:hypothetical protein
MTVSLTGKDTVSINGVIFNDLADGDCAALTFPNDITQVKTGKNGNSIYAFKYDGRTCNLSLRVIRGSANDRFLNQLLSVYKNNPAGFVLLTGVLVKNVGDGAGNVTSDTYTLSGGTFKKETEVKENAEGDTEQAVAIYTLIFSNAPRSIGS